MLSDGTAADTEKLYAAALDALTKPGAPDTEVMLAAKMLVFAVHTLETNGDSQKGE